MLSRRSVIIKNSAVHRELLKRKDAPQALLECYRELDIKDTPYADIMFFEAFSFGMHTFRLKCMQYGAYVLRVDEYYEDIHTGYGQMIIIVEGN